MKKIITILTFLLCMHSVEAKDVLISGKVFDADEKKPIEFASVQLLKSDSTFVKGVVSDKDGLFTVAHNVDGQYLLMCSLMGYEPLYTAINSLAEDVDLGDLHLQTSSVMLEGVTVTAQTVINKADRQLIMPSQTQVNTSANGLDLLRRLQLRRLSIDPINNKINISGGGEVQIRINGVVGTVQDLQGIRPEDIIRIEYHDDPGMRYGNAAAVIDYITRRRESGGSLAANLQHGLTKSGFINDDVSVKVNHKKSEFGFNTFYSYRDLRWTRENEETFHFPTHTYKCTELGEPTFFTHNNLTTRLNYSLAEQDKYYFNVQLRNVFEDMPRSRENRRGTFITSSNPDPLRVSDLSWIKANAPSLDVYYQRNLKNGQNIIFNVVGTYLYIKSGRHYQEEREGVLQTDITSMVRGDKYSLISEGIYERKMDKGTFTTGLKHTQSFTDNEYSGVVETTLAMNQAETYVYAEYMLKIKKLSYTFGLGAMRTYFGQDNIRQSSYIVRPTLRVNYNINDNLFVRYNGFVSGNAPSLSDLNDVVQPMDGMQERRGNPNLKSVRFIANALTVAWNKGSFSADLFARYSYDHRPIMDEIFFDQSAISTDSVFVHTKDNQRGFHRLISQATLRWKPIKEYITFSVSPGFRRFVSLGNNYTHTFSNFTMRINLDTNYKNWLLSFFGYGRQKTLWGESLDHGEEIFGVNFGYNKPKWMIMVGTFISRGGKYTMGEDNLSAVAPRVSSIYSTNLVPMPFLIFRYNLNFGRQYQSGNKRINNQDNDSGVMSGSRK